MSQHCSATQSAQSLGLNLKTIRVWAARKEYPSRPPQTRTSQLDAYKGDIVRLLHRHPYSARQILNQLREQGYPGGYTILKEFIRQVRPRTQPAFLTLHFEPGECAQVDWGYAGILMVGAIRRRLSFLAMVLCYSRRLYVEFTLSETLEQFLACQQRVRCQPARTTPALPPRAWRATPDPGTGPVGTRTAGSQPRCV